MEVFNSPNILQQLFPRSTIVLLGFRKYAAEVLDEFFSPFFPVSTSPNVLGVFSFPVHFDEEISVVFEIFLAPTFEVSLALFRFDSIFHFVLHSIFYTFH